MLSLENDAHATRTQAVKNPIIAENKTVSLASLDASTAWYSVKRLC